MSKLLPVIDNRTLAEKLDEAMDVDTKVRDPSGGKMDMPDSVKKSAQEKNVADTIADHISEVAINISEVESTTLSYGSGDTGRQSQLYLTPRDNVSKENLVNIASELNMILESIFPIPFLVGVTHGNSIDKDGYSTETDDFHLFLVYRARTASNPTPPAGESTEVIRS